MIRRIGLAFAIGLVSAGVLVACGDSRGAPAGQESPRAVLEKVHRSVLGRERSRFLECFPQVSDRQALADAGYDYCIAVHDLYALLMERFGDGAVGSFRETALKDGFNVGLAVIPMTTAWPDSVAISGISTNETEARVRLDNGQVQRWKIKKSGEAWYVWWSPTSKHAKLPEIREQFKQIAAAVREAIAAAKADRSMTILDIKRAMIEE